MTANRTRTLSTRIRGIGRSSYSNSLALRVLNAALSLGITVLLARLLGPREYGAYAMLLATAMLLAIPFTTGLPKAMTREIAAARVQDDPGRLRCIIKNGQTLFAIMVPILAVGAILAWTLGLSIAGTSTGILVSAALAPILAADANRIAVMQGLGQAIKSQIPDMLVRPLGTAVIVVILLITVEHVDAPAGAFAYAASAVIGLVVGYLMLRPSLADIPKQEPKNHPTWRKFLPLVGTLSILGGSKSLTANVDIILVDIYSSLEQAGQYKVALAGLAVVVLGYNAIQAVSYTRIAEAVPLNDKQSILHHSDRALLWGTVLSLATLVAIAAVGIPAINFIYGPEYRPAWAILLILGAGFTLGQALGPAENIAMLAGSQLAAAGCIIIGVVTTVVLAAILAPGQGMLGVAIASMTGTIIRHGLLTIMVNRAFNFDITLLGTLRRLMQARHTSN